MSKKKEYELTATELDHVQHLEWGVKFMDQSLKQFLGAIMTDKLKIDFTKNQASYEIQDGKLIVTVEDLPKK